MEVEVFLTLQHTMKNYTITSTATAGQQHYFDDDAMTSILTSLLVMTLFETEEMSEESSFWNGQLNVHC